MSSTGKSCAGRGGSDKNGKKGDGKKGKGKGNKKGSGSVDSCGASSGTLSPAQLTSYIKNSWTIDDLFKTYCAHGKAFGHIHLSACWNAIGHKTAASEAGGTWFDTHKEPLDCLVQQTIDLIEAKNSEIRARQLANIAHGVAKSGLPVRGNGIGALLMQSLASAIIKQAGDCNCQELANIAWAFAKSGHTTSNALDSDVFSAVATAAEPWLTSFNAQELSNLTWAFATALGGTGSTGSAAQYDVFFRKIAQVVEMKVDEFTSQGLSNTAWAFAKVGILEATLFEVIAKKVQATIDHLNARDFSNIAWSFAKLGQFDAKLFTALAAATEWHLSQSDGFNAQGLSNVTWSFAKAGHIDAKLFARLAKAILARIGTKSDNSFNSQDIANICWAFAKACHVDADLFSGLARAAGRKLEEFNNQDLVNTVWAFAKLGHASEKSFFNKVALSVMGRDLSKWSASNIANIVWAFAKIGKEHVGEEFFELLGRSVEERVSMSLTQDCSALGDTNGGDAFGASNIALVVWAFANADCTDSSQYGGLFRALARASYKYLDVFSEEDLDNTEWAFSRGGEAEIAKEIRKRRKPGSSGAGHGRMGSVASSSAASGSGSVTCRTNHVPLDRTILSNCGRIVIAGGGIGGPALALALQQRGFDVIVIEQDTSFEQRKQGYGFTIQQQGALQVLNVNIAQDDAPSTSHYTFNDRGEILGFYGEVFGMKSAVRTEKENSGRFIHIPRQMLRQRIIEALKPESILWGSRLKRFECWGESGRSDTEKSKKSKQCSNVSKPGKKHGVTITLHDGTQLHAALLIGCDGIFSTVRKQLKLPGDRLNYVGYIVVLGIVNNEDGDSASHPLAKRRIFETVDGVSRIYAMPFTTTSTMWQLSFPMNEEEAKTLSADPPALKKEILRRFGKWHDPVPKLLKQTPMSGFSGYPVYDRELLEPEVLRGSSSASGGDKLKSMPSRRVTLIGDAAHPMTPFKAQGANQALSDAVLFADTLTECLRKEIKEADKEVDFDDNRAFDSALLAFEKGMLSRSSRMVVGSRQKAKEMHSNLALQPARKVQRDSYSGVDMASAVRVLAEKGIGAGHAGDPRGLDTVVAEAIGILPQQLLQQTSVSAGVACTPAAGTVSKKLSSNVVATKKRQCSTEGDNPDVTTGENTKKKRKQESQDSKKTISTPLQALAREAPTAPTKKKNIAIADEGDESSLLAGKESLSDSSRIWGWCENTNTWKKCILLKTKKGGKAKVEWKDGTISVLTSDCMLARVRKTKNDGDDMKK